MNFTTKQLKINNTNVLLDLASFSGNSIIPFEVLTGSRITITIAVKNITAGAIVQAQIDNGFSVTYPFITLDTISANGVGYFTKVFSDIHSLFNVNISVVGGSASFALVTSVADNAVASTLDARISNAEISVDLNHVVQPNGNYDSVRIGNGFNELNINGDGSTNVRVDSFNSQLSFPKVYKYQPLVNGASKYMNVDGSGFPIDFLFAPIAGEVILIDQLSLIMIDKGSMKYDVFASIGKQLTNGLSLEIKTNNSVYNIMNIKDNLDLASFFESPASDRDDSFLDSKDQFRGFSKFKEPIILKGSNGDYIKWIVADKLTKVKTMASSIRYWKQA